MLKIWMALFSIIVLFVPVSYTNDLGDTSVFGCDRMSSRQARSVIKDTIEPLARSYGLRLYTHGHGLDIDHHHKNDNGTQCLLDTTVDVFTHHDAYRVLQGSTRWTCTLCGKAFRSENYLDLHMHHRHASEIVIPPTGPICLADFCDAIMCESQLAYDVLIKLYGENGQQCDNAQMSTRRARCMQLLKPCLQPVGDQSVSHTLGKSGSHTTLINSFVNRTCNRSSCEYIRSLLEQRKPLHVPEAVHALASVCLGIFVTFFYIHSCLWKFENETALPDIPDLAALNEYQLSCHYSPTYYTDILLKWVFNYSHLRVTTTKSD